MLRIGAIGGNSYARYNPGVLPGGAYYCLDRHCVFKSFATSGYDRIISSASTTKYLYCLLRATRITSFPSELIRQGVLQHQLKNLFDPTVTARPSTFRVSPVRERFIYSGRKTTLVCLLRLVSSFFFGLIPCRPISLSWREALNLWKMPSDGDLEISTPFVQQHQRRNSSG